MLRYYADLYFGIVCIKTGGKMNLRQHWKLYKNQPVEKLSSPPTFIFAFRDAKMFVTRRASLRKIIQNINLTEIETVLMNCYKHVPGKPGRPPLSPTGMFLSFILMFLRMESYRDYYAFLEKNQFWRRQLGFEKPPDIGSFTNFLNRIGDKKHGATLLHVLSSNYLTMIF